MTFPGRADQGSKQSLGGSPFCALATIVSAADAWRKGMFWRRVEHLPLWLTTGKDHSGWISKAASQRRFSVNQRWTSEFVGDAVQIVNGPLPWLTFSRFGLHQDQAFNVTLRTDAISRHSQCSTMMDALRIWITGLCVNLNADFLNLKTYRGFRDIGVVQRTSESFQ